MFATATNVFERPVQGLVTFCMKSNIKRASFQQVKPRKHVARDMQKIREKRKRDAGGIFLGERESSLLDYQGNFLALSLLH